MATWERLSPVLARLADQDPRPLTRWPQPGSRQGQPPPFSIGLAAWATTAAAELHEQFGSDVELTVGALRYPQRTLPPSVSGMLNRAPAPQLDSAQAQAVLDGPLRLRSGHVADHGLLVTNHGPRPLQARTTGQLIADIVDPGSGMVVGGYCGPIRAMLRMFTVAPGSTTRIPLLVATDSFVPDLGYAIPPGEWALQTTLDPTARTPTLPITLTP